MSNPTRQWQQFFEQQAEAYDENGFTKNTIAEVTFLLQLYPVPKGASILDVGCGTGRHAIEFARRGYQVVGVDITEGMLTVARRKAEEAGVSVEFVQADARTFDLGRQFDYAVCLCEGGLGLLERGEDAYEHDGAIFERTRAHLKPNAPFVLTCLNGYSVIRQMQDQFIADGMFDPASMVSFYEEDLDTPNGPVKTRIYERLFIPPEVLRLLQEKGFVVDNVYGGTAGSWGQRPLSLDEIEMMVLARRA